MIDLDAVRAFIEKSDFTPTARVVIDALFAIINEKDQIIAQLQEKVKSLEERLNKNSHNSSKPPSSDGFKKKTRSLRKPSGKKPGGQKGHVGHTLEPVDTPDDIHLHEVTECSHCACSLSGEKVLSCERRQVFEIPPLKIKVTEHQAEVKKCPICGKMSKGEFPEGVSNTVQYGNSIHALSSYLSIYQLLPMERISEFFSDLFGHRISKSITIAGNRKLYHELHDYEDEVKTHLINALVMHSDETGLYSKNKRQWLHTASTENLTYYYAHEKRGKEAMDAMAVLPDFNGILVHDFWAPYLKYSCNHALCNAHHLRDLNFVIESEKVEWASEMKALLLEIKERVDETSRIQHYLESHKIERFEASYDRIVENGIKAIAQNPENDNPPPKRGRTKKSKGHNLLLRFQEHKEKVLAFMYDFNVPFDNNLAERDVRMAKVKQKISGTFRTKEGAQHFCRIRGYISTVKKNAGNVWQALNYATQGNALRVLNR